MTTTSLYVSSTGANARLRQLEIVANNLANQNTAGFRGDEASFGQALAASLQSIDGRDAEVDLHVFVRSSGPGTRHEPGAVSRTGGDLDAAIDGPGFFSVQTPQGVRYTRSGNFRVDSAGLLSSSAGYPVLGEGGPISVGARVARIQRDGQLVDVEGNTLGRLSVEVFEDPSQLEKQGQNLFSAPPLARRRPAEAVRLVPGGVEGSNVNPMQQLAQLVVLQRAYDASMEALQADDAASRRLIQEVTS